MERPIQALTFSFERRNRASAIKIALLILLIFGAYLVTPWVTLYEFFNPDHVMAYLNSAGPFAPAVFIFLMAMSVVISPIPSLPLDLAAGVTFGVLLGTVYAVIGAEIGAIFSFLIGRALGREALTRIFRAEIRFCERCSDRHLAIFVFLSRLVPIFSFDLISYGAGLTNISLRMFAVATLFGMIPPTFALTYAGRSVVSGEWLVVVLGLVMVAFFLLVPRLVTRYQSTPFVRLLRGDVAGASADQIPVPPETKVSEGAHHCASCGAPME